MQLHFKEFGAGEPLVMLHGLFGSSDNWLGVTKNLAAQFHVYLLDLRNHGQSFHSEEMDYSLMADDVAEFLNSKNLESANVLGHSLGGKVAMRFALNYPARMKKLVVVDMSPRVYEPEHEPIFRALLALDLEQFSSRTEMENALEPEIPSLTLRRFLLKNIGKNSEGDFAWKMNLSGLAESYPKLAEAISSADPFPKPALFIRGGKSDYILDSDLPTIQKLFPHAKIETIADARHWVHADAPEEFTKIVLDFLSADFAD
ncbi:MAG TPA: alpha/beta fold hydrolase [Verrucomicrobiae bacterium]|nr:alpha/beta fold hydrolase [Verrucomicrobiae bacterium]